MDRFEMFDAMVNRREVTIYDVTGRIVCIELEDGSGHNFNVTLSYIDKARIGNITLFVQG